MPTPQPPSQAPPVPALVTLHVWGVPPTRVPRAAARMALDRLHLRRTGGPRFARLLGTGSGRTFSPRDADPAHWALLATWDSVEQARAFERESRTHNAWRNLRQETLRAELQPLSSRGRWSGREPFGDPTPTRPDPDQPVAALTRARIRTAKTATFWRAVPPVSASLHGTPGLRLALGVGEAPVGLQGTFSLWDSAHDLVAFAHRGAAHQQAITRTATEQWYSEELFARFAVLDLVGTYQGQEP